MCSLVFVAAAARAPGVMRLVTVQAKAVLGDLLRMDTARFDPRAQHANTQPTTDPGPLGRCGSDYQAA